ncbi:hypothetical protein KQ298_06265 [Synechococcus sp. CS-1330]|nr:hypothetical protein [Synechococcus sp. CS-1330]
MFDGPVVLPFPSSRASLQKISSDTAQSSLLHRIAAIGLDSVVEPGQIKATRGPGTATDYALFVLLLSPEGLRTVFIADWLANEDHVKKGFHYVTHRLGHKQGYVLADLVDPAILVKSQGIAFLDRLFAPIEAWLDGGQEPMPSMSNDLMRVEAFTVTIELDDQTELNWQTLTPSGFQPAFRRIGSTQISPGPFKGVPGSRHQGGRGFG